MGGARKKHPAGLKPKAALDAASGAETLTQPQNRHVAGASIMRGWRKTLLEKGPALFAGASDLPERGLERQLADPRVLAAKHATPLEEAKGKLK